MKFHVATASTGAQAVAGLLGEGRLQGTPQLVFAFYGEQADDTALHAALQARWPGAPVIGGSSSAGLMSPAGLHGAAEIGLLALEDLEGDFGVAAAPLGPDPAATATGLLYRALAHAGCEGELPELVWIYQAPGHEEAVLAGLRRVVGDRCPIIGGSSADQAVAGRWRQLGPEGPMAQGLVVAVLFPSAPLRFAFQGGYEPAGPSGLITGIGFEPEGPQGTITATRGRCLMSIDGQPAAQVYNRWLHGRIEEQTRAGGSILAETALHPLATSVGQVDGLTHYLLVHPQAVTPDGALQTFCELGVGERLFAMRGDRQRLIARARRVVEQALGSLPAGQVPAAALIVYCGGCRMAVGEQIEAVALSLRECLGELPFLGCFTFGEQGQLLGRNVHGNLMISAVLFSS